MAELKLPKRTPKRQGKLNEEPSEDKAVQQTNDDAQISKESAVQLGYMKDPYVSFFVKNPIRRPPLINRGYYARCTAIDQLIDQFLDFGGSHLQKQIIILGAGFDTRAFHLLNSGKNIAKYIEIDFPQVIKAKDDIIHANPELLNLLGKNLERTPSGDLLSEKYNLLSVDLRNLNDFNQKLSDAHVDFSLPTLFLSECVLIYMEKKDSDALLAQISASFPSSLFIIYEMFSPNDPFGQTMIKNLESRSISLKGIYAYLDLESQKKRYLDLGWKSAEAFDMSEVFHKFIPKAELQRVSKLELFDEFEEWELISKHYLLSYASQTSEGLKSQNLDLNCVRLLPQN